MYTAERIIHHVKYTYMVICMLNVIYMVDHTSGAIIYMVIALRGFPELSRCFQEASKSQTGLLSELWGPKGPD